MILANFSDGARVSFDLENEKGFSAWQKIINNPNRRRSITGLSVKKGDLLLAIPRPDAARRFTQFGADLLFDRKRVVKGERVWCQVDDIRIMLTVYKTKLVRFECKRVGIPRFQPPLMRKQR